MKREYRFIDADRYRFDFRECSPTNGFAQVDTSQDAWYFGSWLNPTALKYVEYIEGDVTRIQFESTEEMREYVESLHEWNKKMFGNKGVKIDPLLNAQIEKGLRAAGLESFMH